MEVDISNNPLHETNMDTTSELEGTITENAEKHKNQIVNTEELVTTTCSDDSASLEIETCTDFESISIDVKKPDENTLTTPNIYCPPSWALNCPPSLDYKLEVIKNGLQLSECTVCLSSPSDINLQSSCDNGLSYCLFGRQPQLNYAQSGTMNGQCSVLAHPSISRLHAVLQYGKPPHSVGHVSENEKDTTGWYLKDLESTHGTFVNKRRLPPGRYVRIRVGYVLRFGGSTRLHILQGPEDDTEQQTSQSWFDLKKSHEEYKMNSKMERNISSIQNSNTVKLECNWGMSLEDPVSEPIPTLLQSGTCLSHEKLYRDDPKRALNAYFEREGIDPIPQFEFVEAPFGKQHCRIELPLSSGTVTAEALVSGKRKEAVVACALEACQLLDRLGEFDPDKDRSTAFKYTRSRAYWEDRDYYSSDEDTYVDRTGAVERKRLNRMRQLGVKDDEIKTTSELLDNHNAEIHLEKAKRVSQNATMITMLSELEKIGEEIVSIEEELEAINKEFSSKEANPSQLDELEAYMNALKTNSSKCAQRSKLKARLISLRQTELQLFHRAGLPRVGKTLKQLSNRQNNNSEYISSSDAAAAVRAARQKLNNDASEQQSENDQQNAVISEQKIKNIRADRNALKRSLQNHARTLYVSQKKIEIDKPFEVENDDDDDNDDNGDTNVNDIGEKEETQKIDMSIDSEENKIDTAISIPQYKLSKCSDSSCQSTSALNSTTTMNIVNNNANPIDDPSINISNEQSMEENSTEIKLHVDKKQPTKVLGPTLPPSQKLLEVNKKTKDYIENYSDDYVEWFPPSDQSGDGTTSLNAKYGY
uniref:Putative smad nuclear interacting protein n=1 Tax=Schistosoma mansoni TaxID=6183 RepID=A0A3Q0KKL7_SCHMA